MTEEVERVGRKVSLPAGFDSLGWLAFAFGRAAIKVFWIYYTCFRNGSRFLPCLNGCEASPWLFLL